MHLMLCYVMGMKLLLFDGEAASQDRSCCDGPKRCRPSDVAVESPAHFYLLLQSSTDVAAIGKT